MATKIVTKNSSTASAAPTASDLVQGELAVNVTDKRLYTENASGAIVELGTNPLGAVDMASTLTVTGEITANGGIALGDNDKATFGTGDDLQIYHDGYNSIIAESGAGSLLIRGDHTYFTNTAGTKSYADFIADGAVTLRHDNAPKLATTSTGIDVTGTATMDSLSVGDTSSGQSLIQMFANPTNGANTIHFGDGASANAYVGYINYAHDSNSMQFAVGNGEKMRIDSSGAIGFKKIPPSGSHTSWSQFFIGEKGTLISESSNSGGLYGTWLTDNMYIKQSTGAFANVTADQSSAYKQEAGIHQWFSQTSGSANAAISLAERMRIDSSGRVGIGTSSFVDANAKLVVSNGTVDLEHYLSTSGGIGYFGTRTNHALGFTTNGGERMRIDASGNVLVGTSQTDVGYTDSGAGASIDQSGVIQSARSSANANLYLNKLDNDGEIINLRKDGITVGSIGTGSVSTYYAGKYVGLHMNYYNATNSTMNPVTPAGVNRDGLDDLGFSGSRFRDIHLSGTANVGSVVGSVSSTGLVGDFTNTNTSGYGIRATTYATGAQYGLAVDSYGGGYSRDFTVGADGNVNVLTGNLLVGTTGNTPSGGNAKQYNLATGTTVGLAVSVNNTGYSLLNLFYNNTTLVGAITTNGSATAYNTSSDYRLKENVVPMTGSIDRVKALKPSRFNFIADSDTTVDGFLAHEAQEVVPECATGTKDAMRDEEYEVTAAVEEVRDEDDNITTEAVEAVMGTRSVPDMQGIDQAKLVPLLVAALQEAIARIETLEAGV